VAPEQGWDQKAAVESLVRKAVYAGRITKSLLGRIQCTRYQSSKRRVTFEEYARDRGHDETLIALTIAETANNASSASASSGNVSYGDHGGHAHRGPSSGCVVS